MTGTILRNTMAQGCPDPGKRPIEVLDTKKQKSTLPKEPPEHLTDKAKEIYMSVVKWLDKSKFLSIIWCGILFSGVVFVTFYPVLLIRYFW